MTALARRRAAMPRVYPTAQLLGAPVEVLVSGRFEMFAASADYGVKGFHSKCTDS